MALESPMNLLGLIPKFPLGIPGLLKDRSRPGRKRRIEEATVREVVEHTLQEKPSHATHWSTRGMARVSGVSSSITGTQRWMMIGPWSYSLSAKWIVQPETFPAQFKIPFQSDGIPVHSNIRI